MQHPYELLREEYAHNWATMKPLRQAAADKVAADLLNSIVQSRYERVRVLTGVPVLFTGPVHMREASLNFRTYLGNGDPLNQVTTHVPQGRGPFKLWEDGAVDAFKLQRLEKVPNWSVPRLLFEQEGYNGWGYRGRGMVSPYLWAGTNIYSGGKYTSDGNFDPKAFDMQLGTAIVMKTMIDMSPGLLDELYSVVPPKVVPIVPLQLPVGVGGTGVGVTHDAFWIQDTLNKVMKPDPLLLVDGSIGRKTRGEIIRFQAHYGLEPDGFVGPKTMSMMEKALFEIDSA